MLIDVKNYPIHKRYLPPNVRIFSFSTMSWKLPLSEFNPISKFLRPCPELLYDVIWALTIAVTLRCSPCDVTQQAPWQPPCSVKRGIQKRSQFYKQKSNMSGTIPYGLSTTLSIHLSFPLILFFNDGCHIHVTVTAL